MGGSIGGYDRVEGRDMGIIFWEVVEDGIVSKDKGGEVSRGREESSGVFGVSGGRVER